MGGYTSQERFRDTLKGRPRDRVPVFAGTSLWAASNYPGVSFQQVASDAELIVKAQLWAREQTGVDVLYPVADPLTIAEAFGCKVRFPETGPLADPFTVSMSHLDDVKQLPVPDPRKAGRLPVVLEAVRGLRERSNGEIPVMGLFEGPFTQTCRIFEAGKILRMTHKNPTVLEALLEKINEFLIAFGKALIESGVNGFFIPEPTASSSMISPGMFRQFVLPGLQRLTSQLDRPVILHVCGDTQPILPAMGQAGAKVISLDQCMSLPEARGVLPDMVLAGNVDPVNSLLMGDVETVRRDATRCLQSAGTGRFILMPGCAVPPKAPVENLRAMVQAAVEFGLLPSEGEGEGREA